MEPTNLVRLKGLGCEVNGMFYQALKKRERAGDLMVVTIDEYLTSQVCSKRSTRTLEKVSHIVGFSVLACTVCHTPW
ncbi:MAG: hypothetical protein EXX96DRAFT_565470 [Benjaminiella poitrasii]|nr:MAG: hypothetical protein EXX96DRAFT_565470 [Benjaminiella poitrasii]